MSTALVTTRTLLICKPYCKGTINSQRLFFASKSAGTRPFSLATSRESEPCRASIPNTLATQFLPVTCPRLARTSCPRTCRTLFVIAKHAARFLSLRWNVVTEALSSQATLVFGLLRYARKDKSLDCHTTFAMTTCC